MITAGAWRQWPIRARLAVVAGAAMALICTLAGAFVLVWARQEAIQLRKQHLRDQAVRLGVQLRHRNTSDVALASSPRALQVLDPAGAMVAASPPWRANR